jgi:Fe-S cluster biogenesis protein NfuA
MNDKEVLQKVEDALDTMRPYLANDGGNVEIVEITSDNIVKVRLLGACSTCPQSFMTMKAGIEEAIKKAVPQIIGVEALNLIPHPYLTNLDDQL